MGSPACPSRADIQTSLPFWWLTCPVPVSTALDTIIRLLILLYAYLSCLILETSACAWLWFYSGSLKEPVASWQPLYVSANWLALSTLLSSGHSMSVAIQGSCAYFCSKQPWEGKRSSYGCVWAMAYFFLRRAVFLRRKLCQDITTDLPGGQSQYFKHWTTVCNTDVPWDIKFVGTMQVSMPNIVWGVPTNSVPSWSFIRQVRTVKTMRVSTIRKSAWFCSKQSFPVIWAQTLFPFPPNTYCTS